MPMTDMDRGAHRHQLVDLWAGDFGDRYIDRNLHGDAERRPFWNNVLEIAPITSALEVGCNVGANLLAIREGATECRLAGIDVNERALAMASMRMPDATFARTPADCLPFETAQFDLVFTMGVLIHVPPSALDAVTDEMMRCSGKYVLCGEYFASTPEEVPYRGQGRALFRRNWGQLFVDRYPSLALVGAGFLPRSSGVWDDMTWWLFQKG